MPDFIAAGGIPLNVPRILKLEARS
jgi:hypothetical protein